MPGSVFNALLLFVSYPFTGKPIVNIQGVTEKLEEKKREPFDKERLQEIEHRVGFLSGIGIRIIVPCLS